MRVFLSCLLVALLATAATAKPQELSPGQMLDLAARSVASGQHDKALALADALLSRDAEDVSALLIRAHALRGLGQMDEARQASRQAWALADNDRAKYAAALVRAQMLSSSGKRMMSQLWLRRAIQVAPTEAHRQNAVRDFRYVRGRSPWQVNLSFSVAPNSNINNGSTQGTGTYELPVWGVVPVNLSGAALALSGIEMRSGVRLRYRLKDRGRSGYTDLHLSASRSDYTLSDKARRIAPGVKGSDFAFSATRVAVQHVGSLGQSAQFALSGGLSHNRYGGAAYKNSGEVSARLSYPLNARSALSGHVLLQQQSALSGRTSDSHGWRGGLRWTGMTGAGGNRLSFGLEAERSFSNAAALDWQGVSADASLALSRPVLGTRLDLGLTAGRKRFDRGPVTGRGRLDRSLGVRVTVEPVNYDLFGFVPQVTLSARKTNSDFGQYDSEEFGLRFGFRSAF